jgi:DNA-binding beta-propeller fold protein YncE
MPGVKADIVIGQIDPATSKPDPRSGVCNLGGVANPPTETLARQPTQDSLCYPTGLAVDPNTGDLYVADTSNGRVLRFPAPFDPANSSQRANLVLGQSGFTGIPNPQASQSVMLLPYGLDLDPNWGLFVSDFSANRVLLFPISSNTSNGEPASKVIGQASFDASDPGALYSPHHIAVDSVNQIYIADTGHNQIQIFGIPSGSTANQPIASFTRVASGAGLSQPQAVWVNRSSIPATGGYHNDVWVGDRNGISRFAPSGAFGSSIATLTIPPVQVQPLSTVADPSLACPGSGVLITNATTGKALFCEYSALAITQDARGNLYVADASNRVAIHYPALRATNSANYTCAMGCALTGFPQSYLAPGALASLF